MLLLNDIRNYSLLSNRQKIALVSFLIAFSGVLSVIDTMIPKPLPMAKIGIANIVTLVLVIENKYFLALTVAFFRTLISGIMIGSVLTYTYILSLSGAIVSVIFMGIFHYFFRRHFSEIGLSVIGAFFNTLAQGMVITLFFGLDRGTLFLISVFILFSTVTGFITGLAAKFFYIEASKE